MVWRSTFLVLPYWLFVTPVESYVQSQPRTSVPDNQLKSDVRQSWEKAQTSSSASGTGIVAASCAVGVALGWASASRRQAISFASAVATGFSSLAARAVEDDDKLDINNADVADYRKFPGMYPTVATFLFKNVPYKEVSDIYKIKDLPPPAKGILKRYEKNFYVAEYVPKKGTDNFIGYR